jgi:serine phosphatase RsbU (regulator of sigma subunit)
MQLGAVIQRRMLPDRTPCVCGLDIAAAYRPCFEIGGDLYDFFTLNDHSVAMAIADVIGKGLPAAMMMSMFRGTIRAYSDGGFDRHSMEEIMKRFNKVACRECRNGEFITLFMGAVDIQNKVLSYCNCGHEPALLIRGKEVIELNIGGLVLGILQNARYTIETIELQQGDTVLMYTDGLIDAMDFDGECWGKDRLFELLSRIEITSADQVVRTILQYRRRFVGLANQLDDTSIVAVRLDQNVHKGHGQQINVEGL